jgi:hypothetical protein
MEADGLDTINKTSVSAVLWRGDNPEPLMVSRERAKP